MDRVAYINHDIDDARARRRAARRTTCRTTPIEILGDTGPQRIDTLVHDLVEHSERGGRHRPGRDGRRGDEPSCATFMFERVYLGPEATREHEKIGRGGAHAVRSLLRPSGRDPRLDPAAASSPRRVTDYLAGMTDRFCIRTFETLTVPVAFAP